MNRTGALLRLPVREYVKLKDGGREFAKSNFECRFGRRG